MWVIQGGGNKLKCYKVDSDRGGWKNNIRYIFWCDEDGGPSWSIGPFSFNF